MTRNMSNEQLLALLRTAVNVADSLQLCADELSAAADKIDEEARQYNTDHFAPCRCSMCVASRNVDAAQEVLRILGEEVADLHYQADVLLGSDVEEVQP